MKKKIRSISIAEQIDKKLQEDSNYRGLTISANISRILFQYFSNNINPSGKILKIKDN